MGKTPNYTRKSVKKYQDKFDIAQARLPKGSTERIKAMGISTNQFINNAVFAEFERLESGKQANIKPKAKAPKEVNGKPVYRFYKEDEYIKKGGQWWHDVVFFYDDMELNDLFIKCLDNTAEENNGYKDGCSIFFDLVDLQKEVGKISDKEIDMMTDEELEARADELEETIDQTEELKALMKDFVYNDNYKPFFEFIGVYEMSRATK